MNAKKANYFGSENIKPDFLNAKKTLQNSESSALNAKKNSPEFIPFTDSLDSKKSKKSIFSNQKHSFKSNLSKKSPIFIVIGVLFGFIGAIFFSMSLLPGQIEALITKATDSQYTTYAFKSRSITKQILSGKIKLSDYNQNRLKAQGIEISSLNSGQKAFNYKGQTITADNFDDTIKNNIEFREAFNKSKRGRVANFFDDAADSIFKKLGLTRNIFSNYKQTGDNKTDTDSYKNTMSEYFKGESDIRINTAEDREFKDKDGNTRIERVETGEDVSPGKTVGESSKIKAENYLTSTASKVADAGGLACAALKVGNLIAVAVAANEIYQSIHSFLTRMESISKTKAGDGNNAALNPFLNSLSEPVTATYIDSDTNEEKTITGSSLESEGLKFILSEATPDKSKTKHYSIERTFKATTLALTTNGFSNLACNGIRAAGSLISLATTAIPGGGFVKATVGFLINTAIASGIQLTIATILRGLIPYIASSLFTNIFESTTGIPAGELLAKGASASNSRLARSGSGQMPSSANRILSYQNYTSEILAEDAEIERKNLSPLDINSQNTFIGSLLKSFSSFANSTRPVASFFSNLASLTTKSILHPVYATGEGSSYLTTFNSCSELEQNLSGSKGDLYCNPIVTSDPSTNNIEVDDPAYLNVINPNLSTDSSGNQTVKDGSRLAHFINFCTERDSPFGIVDANISSAFQTSFGTVGDNLPFLNDIVDIVNAAEETAAMPWATGEICANSELNPYWDSEMKYYQHYVEINRILDQLGNFKDTKNPVAAYKEHYLKNHPLDNSKSGYLSRISGITKSNAEEVLATIEYFEYLANYTPPSDKDSPVPLYFESQNLQKLEINIVANIIYYDLRNRNLLV